MYFQTLDDKSECVGIYTDGALIFDPDSFPTGLSRTWKYAPSIKGLQADYASLYLEGAPLGNYIPEYLKDDWEEASGKIMSFKRSLEISQVNLGENCFFDLVPERFLVELCDIKNKITHHIFKTQKPPPRYEFNKYLSEMLGDIASRPLLLDKQFLRSFVSHPKLLRPVERLLTQAPYVLYEQFGTRTGRLSTKKGSFPALNLHKEFRPGVLPTNDFFIELDFNGAEVRTLIGLLGRHQPAGDIHQFHLDTVFPTLHTRADAKTAFFAWLYGSQSADLKEASRQLSLYYDRDSLVQKHWDGNIITTPYRRAIHDVDRHHALNYLIQSTAADLALKQFLKVRHLLHHHGSGSDIAFLIHDAIVLDMKEGDRPLISSIISLMKSTNFGTFPINIKEGPTLGDLREHTESG